MSKDLTLEDRKFAIKLGEWMYGLIDGVDESTGKFQKEITDRRNGELYTLTLEKK